MAPEDDSRIAHATQQPTEVIELIELIRPRFTMMLAPAGYGKTFVARLIGRHRQRSTYCDARGAKTASDVASCLLKAMATEIDESDRTLLETSIRDARDVDELAQAIRLAWHTTTPPESLLVLDHFDFAEDQTEPHEFLSAMLSHPHDGRSILVCARSRPRLRTTRFAAPHEQLVLEAKHLRFTPQTIRAWFPQNFTDLQFEMIEQVTHGWPIAVLFLVRAVKECNFDLCVAQMRSGTIDVFEEYFVHEILRDIDPMQLNALIACTATAELSDAEAAIALHETAHAANAILREAPFVDRDPESGLYHLNPLLRHVIERRYASAVSSVRQNLERCRRGRNARWVAARFFLEEQQCALAVHRLESVSMKSTLDADWMLQSIGLWSFAAMVPAVKTPAKWMREARAIWSRVRDDENLAVRSAIVGAYAKICGALGFYGEGRAALEQYQSSLKAEDDRPFAQAIVTLWRTAFAVWEGLDVDIDRASAAVEVLLRNDATNALWMQEIVARYWQLRGQRGLEAAALEAAHHSALQHGLSVGGALTIADTAFHRWFWGEDAAFQNALDDLVEITDPLAMERLRFFAACCRGKGRVEQPGLETPELRAAGYLIATAQSRDRVEARWYANAAISAADDAAAPFFRVVSRVAAACEQQEGRDELLRQAFAIASETASQPLKDAVAALIQRADDAGLLTAMIKRFSGTLPPPSVHLSVFRLQLERNGSVVALQPREAEVLVALALERRGLERERLADRVWPNHTTSNAMNSLKAYVSRLRRKFGATIIVSTQLGYVLSPSVSIDIDDVESLLSALGSSDSIDDQQRRTLKSAADVDLETFASRFTDYEWFVPVQHRLEAAVRASSLVLARDGLARRAWAEALSYANRLFVRDRFDEVSCRLTIQALRGLGDQLGAIRVLNQHESALQKELGITNAERLRELLTDEGAGSIHQARAT